VADRQRALEALTRRLEAAPDQRLRALSDRLEALDRMRATLGYRETLARGFAIVRGDGQLVTTRAAAEKAQALEIEFRDGRLALEARPPKRPGGKAPPGQGSLF
jgi:exodeoxyribonuclease VII large subunit